MNKRHHPRLCRSCHAPMTRQEDACWSCGASAGPDELARAPERAPTPVDAPVLEREAA
jgi:predicted amidophosphoribosyltransferase